MSTWKSQNDKGYVLPIAGLFDEENREVMCRSHGELKARMSPLAIHKIKVIKIQMFDVQLVLVIIIKGHSLICREVNTIPHLQCFS